MDHIIQFLIIGLISTIIGKVESETAIREFVKRYSRNGGMNIINSNEHVLKVSLDILYDSEHFLICKGTYDDIPVAIKMTSADVLYNDEMKVYKALNDDDPESHGIPKIYYHGNVFKVSIKAIVMTLFQETVESRYTKQPRLSDFSVLLIFKQAVQTLQYFNRKRVWHNDIKPQNLFLREKRVFIADFNLSTLNETQGNGYTYDYASSNRFAKVDRSAMDDLESLIFSMWHVAGFDFPYPFGSLLLKHKIAKNAEAWVTEICKRFKFEITQKVFTNICIQEILSGERVPRYEQIIKMLSDAIDEITRITGQTQFEWLPEASSSKPNVLDRLICCRIN